jgi:hypothetical protein
MLAHLNHFLKRQYTEANLSGTPLARRAGPRRPTICRFQLFDPGTSLVLHFQPIMQVLVQ